MKLRVIEKVSIRFAHSFFYKMNFTSNDIHRDNPRAWEFKIKFFFQGHLCKCKDGYHSPNTNCSLGSQYESVDEPCEFIPEINECEGANDCHENATCSDTRF